MFAEPIEKLLTYLRESGGAASFPSAGEAVFNVHKITERAGTLYEKLRYLVDYKEERQIRRSAIERMLRRRLEFEGAREGVARALIEELIAGGYVANNAIDENAAAEVETIIARYRALGRFLPPSFRNTALARRALFSLPAAEIESFFFPRREDERIAEAFAARIRDAVAIETPMADDARERQILLACHRGLYGADDEMMRLVFWLKTYPSWSAMREDEVAAIAGETPSVLRDIQAALSHPAGVRLLPRLWNLSIYFSLIREVVRAYGAEAGRVLADRELLLQFARDFLGKNYRLQYERSRASAMRAVLYVLLTKILLAVALEVPYGVYVLGRLDYLPIVINSVIHPFLLLAATFSVRPLGEANTRAIVQGVENVVSPEPLARIRVSAPSGGGLRYSLFGLLYGALFLAVFSALIAVLKTFRFDLANTALFLAFLALVSFFALRIRHSGGKWRVRREDHRVSLLLFNVFTLPIIQAGKWLARTFSAVNVFVFVLDFIIETPFKLLLHFSDAFLSFLREKQEDVY